MASQLKIIRKAGTATSRVQRAERDGGVIAHARREHVVTPHEEAEDGERHGRAREHLVTEHRCGGLNVAMTSLTTAIAGQHHDVDGRVTVEPEEVLERHRVAAEELGVTTPGDHEPEHDGEQGRRDDLHDGRGEEAPDKERQPAPADAVATHIAHRRDEVHAV